MTKVGSELKLGVPDGVISPEEHSIFNPDYALEFRSESQICKKDGCSKCFLTHERAMPDHRSGSRSGGSWSGVNRYRMGEHGHHHGENQKVLMCLCLKQIWLATENLMHNPG